MENLQIANSIKCLKLDNELRERIPTGKISNQNFVTEFCNYNNLKEYSN